MVRAALEVQLKRMRLLQLSDPHLLADGAGHYRGRRPLRQLAAVLEQVRASGQRPDLLLISGDLCQDESLGGYVHLRGLLQTWPSPVALLCGNHDHPQLLRAALGRRAVIAPAVLDLGDSRLVLLHSHRAGCTEGWLGEGQLSWLARHLQAWRGEPASLPLLVALHHPPVPIGDPCMDAIRLADGAELLALLAAAPGLQTVVFGHVHQYWQGTLPGRTDVPLLGCPSTLCGFGPEQPCPLGRADDPGGLWLELGKGQVPGHRLLRWTMPADDRV
jgi:Icc protein